MELNQEAFSKQLKGKQTSLHRLLNDAGLQVAVTNYGARFVTIIFPDKAGQPTDLVVGFDNIDGYLSSTETYYSALVGRYANRIARGKFSLEGKDYQLSINNAPNHLHGGPDGFHNQVWEVDAVDDRSIKLSYFSPDGEEGFPGNLQVSVNYSLTAANELVIDYTATTDAPTVVNLTSHPFFNLNGQGSGDVHNHLLMIHADQYNPVDASLIPTGLAPVAHTPFDFRMPARMGERISTKNSQLEYGAGYDHNYILNGAGFRSAALVVGERSGIQLEVLTDQPGMQFYSGNHMKGENRVKYGMTDKRREAFCLETQHFPDSPNQPQFPSTVLRPGEKMQTRTVYKFSIAG